MKKKLALGILFLVAVIGIPSVVFLTQQKQDTRSRASASTTLSYSPDTTSAAPLHKQLDNPISFDVMVNPGNNQVSFVRLEINYDQTKLQPVTSNPFTVNTQAFPVTSEGPLVQYGKVLISVTVGADPSKAITQPTKVGTINFITLSQTPAAQPTVISYGPASQVLSVGPNDQASENVLSSTSPAYLSIDPAPTSTPIPPLPTSTPTPQINQLPNISITSPHNGDLINVFTLPITVSASDPDGQVVKVDYYLNNSLLTTSTTSPFNASILLPHTDSCKIDSGIIKAVATDDKGSTNSDSVSITWNDGCPPTVTPTPSPTSIPGVNPTSLNLTVFMHGIGNSGDNANPNNSSLSNKNPLHPARPVTLQIFDPNNQLVTTVTNTINFDSSTGNYKGVINLGQSVTNSGAYSIKIQAPTRLRRLISGGIQNITIGQENNLSSVTLIAGDINSDNKLDILDYNTLIGCYSDLAPAIACPNDNKVLSDLNDNGTVNQFDYNLFLREITVQNGQ